MKNIDGYVDMGEKWNHFLRLHRRKNFFLTNFNTVSQCSCSAWNLFLVPELVLKIMSRFHQSHRSRCGLWVLLHDFLFVFFSKYSQYSDSYSAGFRVCGRELSRCNVSGSASTSSHSHQLDRDLETIQVMVQRFWNTSGVPDITVDICRYHY